MKCSTKYVEPDVHQSTTLAPVRQSSGKIIAESVLPTEEAALLEFFPGMRGAVHVALENAAITLTSSKLRLCAILHSRNAFEITVLRPQRCCVRLRRSEDDAVGERKSIV
jgi:hypothetical protein